MFISLSYILRNLEGANKAIMVKLVYQNIIFGGAETLLLRIGRYFNSRGREAVVYCKTIDPKMLKEFMSRKVTVKEVDDHCLEPFLDNYSDNDIIITLVMRAFFQVQQYSYAYKKECRIFLYVVHPLCCKYNYSSQITKFIFWNAFRDTVYRYIENGNIFFMDRVTIEETENFYHKQIRKEDKRICLLPMEAYDNGWREKIEQRIVSKKRMFTVLAVARADYPFKGYIFGLIEVIKILRAELMEITLTIVTSGAQVNNLYKHLEDCDKQWREYIKVCIDISPTELDVFYGSAHLYVGMGTTILEAARSGIPALSVRPYSYECKTNGFFSKHWEVLGVWNSEGREISSFIKEVYYMSDERYRSESILSREIFVQKYSMDNFYNIVTNAEIKTYSDITRVLYRLEAYLHKKFPKIS